MTATRSRDGAAHQRGEVQLGTLPDQLGVDVLQVVVAPAGLDVGVRGIVLHDVADEPALEPGVVVLAIHHGAVHPSALRLCEAEAAA
jgi:hypothetical protein